MVYNWASRSHMGAQPLDYQTAENQAVQLQQQANQVAQQIRQLADKLQAKVTDPNLSRELMLDLREAAIAIQQQNQSALTLIQQMAQYIYSLESNLAAMQPQMPMPMPMQPRGWAAQPWGAPSYQAYPTATSGFMGNLATGLGLGAGFGLGEDLVDSIFGRW
jgi:hypothetical protein